MVCEVVSALSVRNLNRRWPALRARAGTTATSTHSAMNASRMSTVFHSARDESRSAMARTGQSSPQVPYARMDSPTRVSMSSRSFRMGMSVPSAVVVSTMAMAMRSKWLSENAGNRPTTSSAAAKDTIHVPRPWEPVRFLGLIS